MPRAIGRRRKVPIRDLQVGHRLLEHVHGSFGKVLMCEGEILTAKHIEQLNKWDDRPGEGKLSLYTRAVWAQMTDASGDERPKCDTDPYAAHSIQRLYKTHK